MNTRETYVQRMLDKYGDEAYKSKNQYKIITLAIKEKHSNTLGDIQNKILEDIVYDLSHMPRDWRSLTEERRKEDEEKKKTSKILSQQWQVDHGYIPNINRTLFR